MASSTCDTFVLIYQGITTRDNQDPYHAVVYWSVAIVATTFVASTISNNYSQVDKLWSILPVVYVWLAVCDLRTLLMACLVTVWGIRLTWNFSRRGGYKWPPWEGDEDYRWKIIQSGGFLKILTNPIAWAAFNFLFISAYQNFLLIMMVAPSFVVYTMSTSPACENAPLNGLDFLAFVMFLSFVVLEAIADNQQYAFQTEKHRRMREKVKPMTGEYADGFCQSGLFSIVRKPMYASEQAIWISYYIFSVAAGDNLFNWSTMGCLLLIALFQISGWFTEKISRSKYPKYYRYQEEVPLYLPRPFTLRPSKRE